MLGHRGSNFVDADINRLIVKHNRPFIYLVGLGRGFPLYRRTYFSEAKNSAVVRALSNPDLETLGYGPEVPRGHRGYSMLKIGEWLHNAYKLNRTSITYTFSVPMKPIRTHYKRYLKKPIELGSSQSNIGMMT